MTSPRNFKSIEITACALTLTLSLFLPSFPPPFFFSKFASAQTLASLTVEECLGESVCFSCPFWYQLLTGFRTHLSPQSNDLGCRSQAGTYLRRRKHLLPSLFPKGRAAPGLKGWKTEQRNRQELDSKDQLEETR